MIRETKKFNLGLVMKVLDETFLENLSPFFEERGASAPGISCYYVYDKVNQVYENSEIHWPNLLQFIKR
jgi:hypothetical protein